MENLKTFEGFLGMNKDNNVVEQIIDYVKKNDIGIQRQDNMYRGDYTFSIGEKKLNDGDPFGEEINPEEDMVVKCSQVIESIGTYFSYKVYLNDHKLDCSNYIAYQLWKSLKNYEKNKMKNRKNIEIEKLKKRF